MAAAAAAARGRRQTRRHHAPTPLPPSPTPTASPPQRGSSPRRQTPLATPPSWHRLRAPLPGPRLRHHCQHAPPPTPLDTRSQQTTTTTSWHRYRCWYRWAPPLPAGAARRSVALGVAAAREETLPIGHPMAPSGTCQPHPRPRRPRSATLPVLHSVCMWAVAWFLGSEAAVPRGLELGTYRTPWRGWFITGVKVICRAGGGGMG